MNIPAGFSHVQIVFSGSPLPFGAVVTYGVSNGLVVSPAILAANLHDAFFDTMQTMLPEQISADFTRVKMGPNATGPFADGGGPFTGTSAEDLQSPNTAVLVEKVTNSGGRAGRGRMYFPWVNDASTSDAGVLSSTYFGQWQDAVDAWLARLDSDGTPMHLLHTSPSNTPDEVTALVVDPRTATQRRRLRR